eukprot:INCI12744.1.p1 GENE.INCI12744.1~~INCI12744.1.p1  ORF type:complete len:1008 (-),score=153.72 INCI12744.1:1808-4831(-)
MADRQYKHDTAFRQAKVLLLEADKEDRAGHFESALVLYKQGCMELMEALKNGNEKQRAGYKIALQRYLTRAEVIKGIVRQQARVDELKAWYTGVFGGVGTEFETASGGRQLVQEAFDGKSVVLLLNVVYNSDFEKHTEELLLALDTLNEVLAAGGESGGDRQGSVTAQFVFMSASLPEDDFRAMHQQHLSFAAAVPWSDKRLVASIVRHFSIESQASSVTVVNNANGEMLRRTVNAKDIGGPREWFPSGISRRNENLAGADGGRNPASELGPAVGSVHAPKKTAWMTQMFGPHLRQSTGSTIPVAEALRLKRVLLLYFSSYDTPGKEANYLNTSVPRAVHVLSANCHGQSPVAAIWISCDSDTSRVAREHASTLGEPFFALPLESKRLRGALLHRFGVFRETLPRVVILDGWTGKTLVEDATGAFRRPAKGAASEEVDLQRWLRICTRPGVIGCPLPQLLTKDPNLPLPLLLTDVWDYLVEHGGLEEEGIFRISADQAMVTSVLLHIDTFTPNVRVPIVSIFDSVVASSSSVALASADSAIAASRRSGVYNPAQAAADARRHARSVCAAHLAACVLKKILINLPAQLLTDAINVVAPPGGQLPSSWSDEEMLRAVLAPLGNQTQCVLRWLLQCCARVASHAEVNRMSAGSLAVVIAPLLLQPDFGMAGWQGAGGPAGGYGDQLALRTKNLIQAVTQLIRAQMGGSTSSSGGGGSAATKSVEHSIGNEAMALLRRSHERDLQEPPASHASDVNQEQQHDYSERAKVTSNDNVAQSAGNGLLPSSSAGVPAAGASAEVVLKPLSSLQTDVKLVWQPAEPSSLPVSANASIPSAEKVPLVTVGEPMKDYSREAKTPEPSQKDVDAPASAKIVASAPAPAVSTARVMSVSPAPGSAPASAQIVAVSPAPASGHQAGDTSVNLCSEQQEDFQTLPAPLQRKGSFTWDDALGLWRHDSNGTFYNETTDLYTRDPHGNEWLHLVGGQLEPVAPPPYRKPAGISQSCAKKTASDQ